MQTFITRLLAGFFVLWLATASGPASAQAPRSCGPVGSGQTCDAGGPAVLGTAQTPVGAGNPVNLISGNKYQREVDLAALPGVLGLELVRHYNSAFSQPGDANGIIGRGWRLSYETDLYVRGDSLHILQADGSRLIFDRNPDDPSTCASDNPAHGRITVRETPEGPEYTWHWPEGRQLLFNAQGRLVQILAPGGEFVSLRRAPNGDLLQVTDPQGRSLQLRYLDRESAARNDRYKGVVAIDTPVGEVRYDYGAERPAGSDIDPRSLLATLVRVHLPARYEHDKKRHAWTERGTTTSTVVRHYHHEDPRHPTLLTGISVSGTGSDGRAMAERLSTFAYDANGKAILSVKGAPLRHDAQGQPVPGTRIEQVTLARSTGLTRATNSLGQVTLFRHAIIAGEYRMLEARGPGCAGCPETNVRYRYDRAGRLTAITRLDESGDPVETTHYELDTHGRRLSVSRQDHRQGKSGETQLVARYAYASPVDGLASPHPLLIARPSVVPGREHQVRIDYNDAWQPVQVTESGWTPDLDGQGVQPITRTTRFTYVSINGRSLLSEVDGPLPNDATSAAAGGDITRFTYDARGSYPTSIAAPGNQVIRIVGRDQAGRPLEIVTPGNIAFHYELDAAGRILRLSRAGTAEHFRYNALGQLSEVTQASGQRLQFAYRPDGRVAALFDAQNNRITLERDREGHLQSRSLLNPDGSIAQQEDLTRPHLDQQAPAGLRRIAAAVHDVRDPGGDIARLVRAADGLPEAVFEPGQLPIKLAYDSQRKLAALTDARELATRYWHDDFGRLLQVSSPDSGVTRYTWDAADRLQVKTSALGTPDATTIRYRHDAAGRVTEQHSAEGTTFLDYGEHGRVTRLRYPAGEEHYRYDPSARLSAHTRIIDGHRFTTRYAYDSQGRLQTKTLPDGQVLHYHYNGAVHPKAGLLQAITRKELFGQTVIVQGLNDAEDGYAHQTRQLAHGIDWQRQLDKAGQITRIGAPGIWEESHVRNVAGQLSRRQALRPARTGSFGYQYDPLGRLTGIVRAGLPKTAMPDNLQLDYDAGGNLLAKTASHGSTRFAVDAASNRILSATSTGRTDRYAYNGAGSVTQIGSTAYHWDSQQRLVKVSKGGRPVAEYRYNPFGERISKLVYRGDGKQVTYFFHDGSRLSAEAQVEHGKAQGKARIIRQYVWLPDQGGSRPIAMLQSKDGVLTQALAAVAPAAGSAAASDVYAIVTDHTGAPRALVDANRQIAWQADVSGFGHVSLDRGNRVALHLRGSNQYYDEETGLHYNLRRYLDPGSSRYLSADPSGQAGGINVYAFAANNPLAYIDPLGLQAVPIAQQPFNDKLQRVLHHTIDALPAELGRAYEEWLEDLPTTAAVLAIWGASHAVGVGFIADIALVGMAVYTLGTGALDFVRGVIDIVETINNAQCDSDLQQAGATLAQATLVLAANVGSRGKSGDQAVQAIFGGGKQKANAERLTGDRTALATRQTSVKNAADEVKAHGLRHGLLRQIDHQTWETRSGLRFAGLDPKKRDRIEHVVEHLFVNNGKRLHSVFNVQPNQLLKVLDEAWAKRDKSVTSIPEKRTEYVIELNKPIGTSGETKVRVIIKENTMNEIISAYPVS